MENLVGRKVIALQSYPTLGLTKGKEYEIINQRNDNFYFITDLGRKEFTSLIDSNLFRLVDEPQFKQGDKVLVSDNNVNWYERTFVLKYKSYYCCESPNSNNGLVYWKYIKPYEEEITVSRNIMISTLCRYA